MTDDLIEDFLDSMFTAQTNENKSLTWREYFKRLCLGHLPLFKVDRPRQDWYELDPITNEQYPEFLMMQDLAFIEPMVETYNGKPTYEMTEEELDAVDWGKTEPNWQLAAQTLERVVNYLFRDDQVIE